MVGSQCEVCGKICGPLKGRTKSWRCAGQLSGRTAKASRLHATVESESEKYDSAGKRRVREAIVRLCADQRVKTVLDFWGGGSSARALAGLGVRVVSAEIDRGLFSALELDASENGYEAWRGRASSAVGQFDLVFADFCGGASPQNRRELRRLAQKAERFLVVTLAPDHQREEALTGSSAFATIPAWLIEAAPGFHIVDIRQYQRNERKQWMWSAILARGKYREPLRDIIDSLARRRRWSGGYTLKVSSYFARTPGVPGRPCTVCSNPERLESVRTNTDLHRSALAQFVGVTPATLGRHWRHNPAGKIGPAPRSGRPKGTRSQGCKICNRPQLFRVFDHVFYQVRGRVVSTAKALDVSEYLVRRHLTDRYSERALELRKLYS